MSSPFGPKSAIEAEAGDLFLISRGEGAGLEVEKLDPTAAETAALIALGIDAHLGNTAWRTGAGSGGSNVILWGTAAPTGDDGANDDFWINTTAWVIYGPKASGAWPTGVSLIGPPGNHGDDGADGAAFLSGAGAPSGGTGANGDAYFDTTGKTLYGPKTGGAWGSGTSLVGAPGDDGDDGDDGRDPEFQATATHIEWRLVGDVDWSELVLSRRSPVPAVTTATMAMTGPMARTAPRSPM